MWHNASSAMRTGSSTSTGTRSTELRRGHATGRAVSVHAVAVEEVLGSLGADREGLGSTEAAHRLERYGPNLLPDATRDPLVVRILKHFNDVLIYILLAAVVVTALLRHWIDSGVILGVVVFNALIGFVQQGKAEQALEGIRKMLSLDAHVRRDGQWTHVDAELLVPGDVVRGYGRAIECLPTYA